MSKDQLYTITADFIKTVGFPVVVAVLLLYAMNEQVVSLRGELTEQRIFVRQQLSESLSRANSVIEKNTEMYGRLLDRLEREDR